ncbi:MAG: nucleotide exchange factor GrpE [Pseudomonadota bacterium]
MADDKPDTNQQDEALEPSANAESSADPGVDEQQADQQEADEAHQQSAPSGAEANAENAEEKLEAAVAERTAELKDQMLRGLAEVDNVKRRAARDVENAHKFAVEKLINDLFPVLDSLEKAVETAGQTEGAEAIAEGVSLSLKLFVDTLAKSGVAQIDPMGEPFDPQLHEAMTMVPNPDAEPNSVMDVMAKGYTLNGRLVRAAKVIVVKGD